MALGQGNVMCLSLALHATMPKNLLYPHHQMPENKAPLHPLLPYIPWGRAAISSVVMAHWDRGALVGLEVGLSLSRGKVTPWDS